MLLQLKMSLFSWTAFPEITWRWFWRWSLADVWTLLDKQVFETERKVIIEYHTYMNNPGQVDA